MEKRKVSAKVLSLFMVLILMFSFSLTVSAKAVEFDDSSEGSIVFEDSDVQPNSFDRTDKYSLTSGYKQFFSDDNWWGENAVIVQYVSGPPNSISVYVIDSGDNVIGPKTIAKSNSAGFLLKNTGKFTIYAKTNDGTKATCTLRVILNYSV